VKKKRSSLFPSPCFNRLIAVRDKIEDLHKQYKDLESITGSRDIAQEFAFRFSIYHTVDKVQLTVANVIKLFTAACYAFSLYAGVFVPDKPLQPCLMFAGKAGAYPSEAPFRYSLLGSLLALPTNITLGWKSLLGTNALAYFKNL